MDRDEQLKLRREHVALVFQSFALLPMLSAAENIGVPMRLSRVDSAARDQRMSYRGANSSGSASRERLPTTASCCSPTSRRASLTRRPPARSWG
jgi:predicted ABC-type transport system involved in lysophospholipase L1 biosynthesis ATPase subunit